MEVYSLINISKDFDLEFKAGDIIEFEMPSFCSGDYKAEVQQDDVFGTYINAEDNYFEGCRDFIVLRNGKEI